MQPLEVVIALKSDAPDAQEKVRAQFAKTEVFALGQPAGDTTSVPGTGTESDLLHFAIEAADGSEQIMMPVFTRPDVMKDALLRNPEWQTLMVLQVSGRALLENLDKDVTVVINPWSKLEFQLPVDSRPGPDRPASIAAG